MTTLLRAGRFTPSTVNEAERTVELVVATGNDVGDGVVLTVTREAVEVPPLVPVLLDHASVTQAMGGRLENVRVERGQLIGLARFTDAPAADQAWQLARSGCAVSCRAAIDPEAIRSGPTRGAPDVATRWRLVEASLTPIGRDPSCITRSAHQPLAPQAMTTTNPATSAQQGDDQTDNDGEPQLTRAQAQREAAIYRSCTIAGMPERAEAFIRSGATAREVGRQLVEELERRERPPEGQTRRFMISPLEDYGYNNDGRSLEAVLRAKLGDPRADRTLRTVPLARAIQREFYNHPKFRHFDWERSSDAEICRAAQSTADFSNFLESSANRVFLNSYETAPQGIRALARVEPNMTDFRPVSFLRMSEIGAVTDKPQGGEYQQTTLTEELAATVTAREYGRIVNLTRQAVINDDLGAFAELASNLARGAARAEGELLASILATFSFGTSNSATGVGVQAAITAGTIDLRRQTGPNGERLQFEPGVLVVAPEQEADARQVLADYQPTTAAAVAPFRNLQLEIDAQLPSGTAYLADTAYLPLILGTIGAPSTTMEEDFDTGNRRFKVQHDFGAALIDFRSVVKLTIS